jgi:hypothetical protein
MPLRLDKADTSSGTLEKVYFVSEIGQHIPGLLWLPERPVPPARTVVVVDHRGKSAVAESDLVKPMLDAGFAVLSVDLRGRGETLGRIGTQRDNNYHFVSHSVMWGEPLAARRAFDLKRAVDFVHRRRDLPDEDLVVVGLGDEALPALLAAATDPRIKRVVCAGYVSSFVSQMIPASLPSRDQLVKGWNRSAMRWGRLKGSSYEVDLGSVIPSVLKMVDIPELVSMVAPRKVLSCQARDNGTADAPAHRSRFVRVTSSTSGQAGWVSYRPDKPFNAQLLLGWLGEKK